MKKKLIPAVIWLSLLLIATLIPGNAVPKTPDIFQFDKLVHFGLFFILTMLWGRVWLHHKPVRKKNLKIITNYLVFGIFFAILVEYLQRYVPGRSFDYLDIVANISGGTIGIICLFILTKRESSLV